MAREEKMSELLLDLRHNPLFGWEGKKNSYTVESICNGIDSGDAFPPVAIILVYPSRLFFWKGSGEPRYFIQREGLDTRWGDAVPGGHHRAYAHLIRGKALPCFFAGEVIGEPYTPIAIEDIVLEERSATALDGFRLKQLGQPRYR